MLTYLFTSRYQLNKPYRVNSLVFIDHRDSRPLIFNCMKQRFTLFSLKKKMKIEDARYPDQYGQYHGFVRSRLG